MESLSSLVGLLSNPEFKLELKAFKCAYQRLKIRLRNNLLIKRLKQIVVIIRQLDTKFQLNLIQTYIDNIKNHEEKRRNNAYKSIIKLMNQMILFIDNSLESMIQVYCHTQPHFRVGHLIHHLIVIRTSISRLRICFKAALVYLCDSFLEVTSEYKGSLKNIPSKEDIRQIMVKNRCKPRVEVVINSKYETQKALLMINGRSGDELIGELIDRASFKK